jgi:hypothetical protein
MEKVKSRTTRNVNAKFVVVHLLQRRPKFSEGRQRDLCFTGWAINDECNGLGLHDLQGIHGTILNEAKCKRAYVLIMWLLTYWPLGRFDRAFLIIFNIF